MHFYIKNNDFIGQFLKISVQTLRFNKTRFLVILSNLFFFAQNSKFFQKFTVVKIAVRLLSVRSSVCVVTARVYTSYLINVKTQKILRTLSKSTAIFTAPHFN